MIDLQREVYPSLLLFSAERKNNTVRYEGDISVSDIIKFLAAHGSHIPDLITDKSRWLITGALSFVLCNYEFLYVKDGMDRVSFSFDF